MKLDEAYSMYTTLRLHFTTNNFDVRAGIKPKRPKNGVNSKIGASLQKLIKKYPSTHDFAGYFISNFLEGDMWGGLYSPAGDEVFVEWKRRQESLTYNYQQEIQDLATYVSSIEELWDTKNGHPVILRAYFGKICSLETLVILNKLYKFIEGVDEKLGQDPVWIQTSDLSKKYSPFIKINKEKFKMLTEKWFL